MTRPTVHGEIWWADIDKRRPVVVASRDAPRGARVRTTVAVITRTRREIPTEVAVDERDGLPQASVVNCDELVTIPKSDLERRIGRLAGDRLEAFHRAMRFALGIPQTDRRS